jgi:uncharacterized protein (DUF2461 family)
VGTVRGDALSRAPRGFDPDHPLIEDIKRKSFYGAREADEKLARSPALVGEVTAAFKSITPLMRFLCDAQGVPF